jgi:hypothetical protein
MVEHVESASETLDMERRRLAGPYEDQLAPARRRRSIAWLAAT